MNNIIILQDNIYNGKDNILSYKTYYFFDIIINDNNLFYNNINILNNINTIIFNVNECKLFFDNNNKIRFNNIDNMIQHIYDIYNIIKNYNKDIIVYNKPDIMFKLGSKLTTYDILKNKLDNTLFKIPQYLQSNEINNINSIDYFPVICKEIVGSCSGTDFIAYNKDELIDKINNNYLISQFIDSYDKENDCFHSIRLMICNNKLIDYHNRPCKTTNSRAKYQIKNKNVLLYYDNLFNNYINTYKESFNKSLDILFEILGEGLYSIDCILYNNKLYICEIGYKIFDNTYKNFLLNNNFLLNKISSNTKKYLQILRNIIES